MEKITVEISQCGDNYCCGWGHKDAGAIIVTKSSLEETKQAFLESLEFHIAGMKEDGNQLPAWLANGDYEVEFKES